MTTHGVIEPVCNWNEGIVQSFKTGALSLDALQGHCVKKRVTDMYTYTYVYTYTGASGVMVIVVGNGHGVTSSIPGRDWLHFT